MDPPSTSQPSSSSDGFSRSLQRRGSAQLMMTSAGHEETLHEESVSLAKSLRRVSIEVPPSEKRNSARTSFADSPPDPQPLPPPKKPSLKRSGSTLGSRRASLVASPEDTDMLPIFQHVYRQLGEACIGESEAQRESIAMERAATMVKRFRDELGVYSTAKLVQAMEAPEVAKDVRQLMRGLLFPSLKRALFWQRARSGLLAAKRMGRLAAIVDRLTEKAEISKKGLRRRLELVLADMTQLSAIDQVTQTFKAALFIILRFKDGALDDDLVKEFDGFPVDAQARPTRSPTESRSAARALFERASMRAAQGKPTFLPSATWYLNQIEFSNGQDLNYIDHKARPDPALLCPISAPSPPLLSFP